jgi:uncharacterized protein
MLVEMSNSTDWRRELFERHRWLVFVLPFLVYMLAGGLEPAPGKCAICYANGYAVAYGLKIALTVAAVAFVWPGYREFPPRLSLLAILVGAVGGPLWIALCWPDWEHTQLLPLMNHVGLGWIISSGDRAGFNPLEQLADQPVFAWGFLAIRFFGLVAVVPLIEEFFLRGFLMRFVADRDWWKVSFDKMGGMALVVGTAVPMLTHPGELLAAAVWFSMITWLMLRTRNIWDCVAAHAITNLILGIYVVTSGTWRLM